MKKKRGRPKKQPHYMFSFKLPVIDGEMLESESERLEISKTDFILRSIRRSFIEGLPDEQN